MLLWFHLAFCVYMSKGDVVCLTCENDLCCVCSGIRRANELPADPKMVPSRYTHFDGETRPVLSPMFVCNAEID
jgi:hypothetical protein